MMRLLISSSTGPGVQGLAPRVKTLMDSRRIIGWRGESCKRTDPEAGSLTAHPRTGTDERDNRNNHESLKSKNQT